MTLISRLIFSLAIIIMTIINSPIQAKSYHWDNISHEQYVDNLVACQTQIKKFKWSINNSNENSTKRVRTFDEVFDVDIIHQQVIDSLKMQNILYKLFNTSITTEMLQHDINRMAENTKDAKSLTAIFALFDNDATTIAQCISKPYLIRMKTQNNYDYNHVIHAQVKKKAQVELHAYLNGENIDESMGQVSIVNYVTHSNQDKKYNNSGKLKEQKIELTQKQFTQKIQELRNDNLQEKSYGFLFSEIVEQNNEGIEVKTIFWPKNSFNSWIEKQKEDVYIESVMGLSLTIPEITGSNSRIGIKNAVMEDTWQLHFYAPFGRHYPKSIWTGSEMIVWGGWDGDETNSGARYNPESDSWRPTSTGTNALNYRSGFSAIWDNANNQMIVWGGDGPGSYTNTGGRYDPSTDTWQPTSTGSNVPIRRSSHTAIWDTENNQMIIWGGYYISNGIRYLNTGGRYNPTTDTWQPINIGLNVPSARIAHSAIWDEANNQMIIWGGYVGGTSSRFSTGGRYDPSLDSWQPTSTGFNVPSRRRDHNAVWDTLNNQMIIWGGFDGSYTNTGGRYSPSTNSWQSTSIGANVPTGRLGNTVVWDTLNDQMIIWGGFNGDYLNSGGRYNPSSNSWQSINTGFNVPSNRDGHTAVWDTLNNQMIIWGGFDGSYTNTGGRYSPSTDSWQPINGSMVNVPVARFEHTAVWDTFNNQMIIWGGSSQSRYLNTGGRYDPIMDNWQSTSTGLNVPSVRRGHTAIWDSLNNQMIIWGGIIYSNYLNTGGRYDPNTDSWQSTKVSLNTPSPRRAHTAIWDTFNNQMIIWGGDDIFNGTNYLNTGGRYNPNTDSWQPTSVGLNVPNGRTEHTVVWDTLNNQMIVWGGYVGNGDKFKTGGRYDSSTDSWQLINTGINVPIARDGHTAIWDTRNNQMIIWGGYNLLNEYLNTGSRYDPSLDSWQSINSGVNAPIARSNHTSVWDTLNEQMIIWGGYNGNFTNTGGRYNPSLDSWQTINTLTAPSGRDSHSTVWTGNKMIIWGGKSPEKTNSMGIYDPGDTNLIFNDGFE